MKSAAEKQPDIDIFPFGKPQPRPPQADGSEADPLEAQHDETSRVVDASVAEFARNEEAARTFAASLAPGETVVEELRNALQILHSLDHRDPRDDRELAGVLRAAERRVRGALRLVEGAP